MPKNPRVRDLVPDDLPPAAQVQKFETFYISYRDLKLAACKAGLKPSMGERLYRESKVRERIEKKIALVDAEEAKVQAKANLLTVSLIDSLVVEQLKRKERLAPDMFKLAYGRVGLVRDGEFYVAPDPGQNVNAPSIYRRTRTVTEQLTETVVNPIFAVKEY